MLEGKIVPNCPCINMINKYIYILNENSENKQLTLSYKFSTLDKIT